MTRAHCRTARDRNGDLIIPGMTVLYLGCKSGPEHFFISPLPVKVVDIHRQGADGTILTCDGPPKPDYPHHFSCTASDTRVFITGSEILTYEVALDMHAISVMATKAGGNRTGRSRSGPVTVVITKREPVPQTPFRGEAITDPEKIYHEGRRILAKLDPEKEPKQ